MGTWPIYKNYYTRLVRKMAWYKILIHVLIVYFLRITMCFPYWWCTKHAQLIMGTWPIYKKTLLTTDLNKNKLSFYKISPHDFFFLSFFSICTCYSNHICPLGGQGISHDNIIIKSPFLNRNIWNCAGLQWCLSMETLLCYIYTHIYICNLTTNKHCLNKW